MRILGWTFFWLKIVFQEVIPPDSVECRLEQSNQTVSWWISSFCFFFFPPALIEMKILIILNRDSEYQGKVSFVYIICFL